jgi:O-antigen/teichoic acid export membrane protein
MKAHLESMHRLIKTGASGISERARWSFLDQVLISGVNVLTGVLLVRALGLQEFGEFSLVMIGVQFLAGIQSAIILAPMMSLFDQRGTISQSSYLTAVLLHQSVFSVAVAVFLIVASPFPQVAAAIPIDLGLAMCVIAGTQIQDLTRRFFYVTEQPARAFLSDVVTYGVRLVVLALLAQAGALTTDRIWIVIAATSAVAALLLAPDLMRLRVFWPDIVSVTERHRKIAGWLLGNTVVGWFSESNFILLIIGAVLGPVQLGAARAVQNLIHLANLLLQALENFVPSAATKSLLEGGPRALLQYVNRIAALGAGAILVMTVFLMLFADLILTVLYGRTFPDQLAILAILGAYAAFGHVSTIVLSGLRALSFMRPAFFVQVVIAAISVAMAWPLATHWGVVGALAGVLVARAAITGCWILLLRRRTVSEVEL